MRTAREIESQYRAFFALPSVGVVALDPKTGQFLEVNDAFCRLTGYPHEQLLHMTFSQLAGDEDRAAEIASFGRFVASGRPAFTPEKRVVRGDGTIAWVQVDGTLLRDARNRPIVALGIVNDVTAWKLSEAALRESEDRFRLVADAAPVLLWMSGPDAKCTYFNDGWLRFTGRPLERELGDGWAEGVHREDLGRCLAIYMKAFEARRPFEMEYRLRRGDGAYRWVVDRGAPRYAPGGQLAGYIGFAIDITERKVEEEAANADGHAQGRIEQAVTAVDLDWRITYWNQAAERLYGWSAKEVQGRDVREVIVPQISLDGEALALADGEGGEAWAGERLLRRRDGTELPGWVVSSPITGPSGAILGRVAVSVGLAERQLAADAAREDASFARDRLAMSAAGYALTSRDARNLVAAVVEIYQHTSFLSGVASESALTSSHARPQDARAPNEAGGLTPREREVARLLALGKSNKEVAAALGVSIKTAETHRANIMRKLRLTSTAHLVRYAVRVGLVEP